MRSSAPDPLLVQLSGHRWLVPLLADLASRKGARLVELIHRLGLSRDSLTRTLQAAAAPGWVRRNPGNGHPLRPERSEEHTSKLQSLMRISYAVFCMKKKKKTILRHK